MERGCHSRGRGYGAASAGAVSGGGGATPGGGARAASPGPVSRWGTLGAGADTPHPSGPTAPHLHAIL